MFAAFSALSLIVSIIKGIVPIYLLESAGWAGLAWYWQRKNTHSEMAKGIVIVFAVVVAVGEAVHIVTQAASGSKHIPSEGHAPVYPGPSADTDPYAKYAISPSISSVPDSKPSSAQSLLPAEPEPVRGKDSRVPSAKLSPEAIRRRAFDLYRDTKYKEAAPLLDQSCTNGYAHACETLGFMYEIELGLPGDSSKAAALYSRAAGLYTDACDSGSADDCQTLSDIYDERWQIGYPHIDKKHLPRRMTLFSKACDAGSGTGCFDLGILYKEGKETVQDYSRALTAFSRACDANDAWGCGQVGESYRLGLGVAKDLEKARTSYVKGCNLGAQWACDAVKELN